MNALADAHGLVVGIANYQNVTSLPASVLADARDVHGMLTNTDLCAYPPGNVALLLDGEATASAIRSELARLAANATSDSTVCIYLSSHGGRIEDGPGAGDYLIPVDASIDSDAALAGSAISGAEFTEAVRAIPARKLLVLFDCCHSGGIGQPKAVAGPAIKALPESYYETLATGVGRVIIASSRSSEFSYVLPAASNSLFTHHLLDALRGGAPGPGGVIRVFDVFGYVQPRVTADQPNQHPIFKAEVEDNFPVALYLGGKSATPTAPSAAIVGATSMATLAAQGRPRYDVFLSYAKDDPQGPWVRQTLRPRLEQAGLRACIDHRDFRLGAARIREIERAVEQSRYTLAVLTPAYVESNFAELESVLAQHLGEEESERRFLAVMREKTRPRLSIRATLWLDMTDDRDLDINVDRLVYELSQPSER
jgi:hypothetical protein